MKTALSILIVTAVSLFASGCSLLGNNIDKLAKGGGELVKFYCENITIPEVREEIRAAVNAHAAPHSIAIECADGGPIMRSADPNSVTPAQ